MLSVLSAIAPSVAPTSSSPNNTIDALLANLQSHTLEDERYLRTQWSIIISCFVTVVACAWVAIHPNVQCTVDQVNSTKWRRCQDLFGRILRGKVTLVFIFLVFPEFIVAWAVSQCQIVNYAHWIPGWTIRHTWFTMMGGFYIDNGPGLPSWPMDRERVFALLRHKEIRVPPIEEIDDKSNCQSGGGLLSRVLTLMQVIWFLVQCFVRATTQSQFNSQSLHISKLEILTLAYLVMTLWMYIVWWNKPLDVKWPILIHRKSHWYRYPIVFVPPGPTANEDRQRRLYYRTYVKIVNDLVYGFSGEYAYLQPLRRVPTFYGGDTANNRATVSFFYVCIIGGMFAGINSIAWSYEAPSTTEAALWRLSCLAGLGLILQFMTTFKVLSFLDGRRVFRPYSHAAEVILAWTMTVWGVVYVIFRVMSIVLAVRELNTAPLGVFETVHWVECIPHV